MDLKLIRTEDLMDELSKRKGATVFGRELGEIREALNLYDKERRKHQIIELTDYETSEIEEIEISEIEEIETCVVVKLKNCKDYLFVTETKDEVLALVERNK